MAESEEEIKSLLMKVKKNEKAGLKLNIQKPKILASGPTTSRQVDGETMEMVTDFIFLGSKNHCRWWLQPQKQKMLGIFYANKSNGKPGWHVKKQRHCFTNKGLPSQSYDFSSIHVWMWELGYKESWTPKNWCFWTVVLEKTLESPLDFKEVQPDQF